MRRRLSQVASYAAGLERRHRWLAAAEIYEDALGMISPQDTSMLAKVQERRGEALYNAAMQSEKLSQFQELMRKSIKALRDAERLYTLLGAAALKFRCKAMRTYLRAWLSPKVADKKRLLDKCWVYTKKSLKIWQDSGQHLEYGKTFNQLSMKAALRVHLEWDFESAGSLMREVLEHGEDAIRLLSSAGSALELSRAYVITACWLGEYQFHLPHADQQENCHQKAKSYWKLAHQRSGEAAVLKVLDDALGGFYFLGSGSEQPLDFLKTAEDLARRTRSNLLLASALDKRSYQTFWKALNTPDLDERVEILRDALRQAHDAKQHYHRVSFISPRAGSLWSEVPDTEHYQKLAQIEFDRGDLEKARELGERSLETAPVQLERAKYSGYPEAVMTAHLVLSRVFLLRAQLERNLDKKFSLLERALDHGKEYLAIAADSQRFVYWNLGAGKIHLSKVKSAIASLIKDDADRRRKLLGEAIEGWKGGLDDWKKCESRPEYFSIEQYSNQEYQYGRLLERNYDQSGKADDGRMAAIAYESAARSSVKALNYGRAALSFWRAGKLRHLLRDRAEAAENFRLSSVNSNKASAAPGQSQGLLQDATQYMDAWHWIEEAIRHDERHEYGSARDCYYKAVNRLQSSKRWGFLATYYEAWGLREKALVMAKRGRKKKAISMSSEASRVFQQSTTLLEMGLTSVDEEEKPAILKLQSEAAIQRLYCNCRGNLEEAFLLWETGDLQSSRQKFVSARETLEKIRFEISQREDLVENPDLITGLSKVLELVQLLEDARVEDPDLYWEVSRLFVNFRLVYDAPIGVDEYEYRQTVRRNLPYGMKIVLGRMTGSEDRKVSVLYLFRIVKKEFVRYPEKGEPGRLLHALGDLIDFPTRKVGALKKAISRGLRDLRNLSPPFLKSDGKESRITPEGNAWLNRKIRQLRRITPPSSR